VFLKHLKANKIERPPDQGLGLKAIEDKTCLGLDLGLLQKTEKKVLSIFKPLSFLLMTEKMAV